MLDVKKLRDLSPSAYNYIGEFLRDNPTQHPGKDIFTRMSGLTPAEALHCILVWHGITGYTDTIIRSLRALDDAELKPTTTPTPTQTPTTARKTKPSKGWRRFAKHDWYGWAGAESFPDGTPPFIRTDIRVDGHPATAICDAQGTEVTWYTHPDGEGEHIVQSSAPTSGVWLSDQADNNIITEDALARVGFRRVQ